MSGLLQTMQRYYYGPNKKLLCISKDLRRKLLGPYNGTQVTQEQKNFNSSMSRVRVTKECFGKQLTISDSQISRKT